MTYTMTRSFAAFVAVILAFASIGAIVTVPPTSAQSVSPIVELA